MVRTVLAVLLALVPLPLAAWVTGVTVADCLAFGNDQPEHIFSSASLWAGVRVDPDSGIRTVTHFPLTGGGFYLLAAPLDWVADPALAARWVRVFAWMATAAGMAALLGSGTPAQATGAPRPVYPATIAVATMAGTLALGGAWYGGFVNFTIGAAAGLALIAVTGGERPWSGRRSAGVAAGLMAVGFLHLFAAAATGLWVLIHQLSVRGSTPWWRTLLRVVAIGTPVLALQALVTISFQSGEVLNPEELQWGLRSPLLALGTLPIGGPWWRSAPPAILAIAGAGYTLAQSTNPARRALAIWAGLLMLAGYLLPVSMPGWSWMSPRLAWFGIAAGIACLSELPVRARTVAAVAAVTWGLAGALWSAQLGVRWQQSPCSQLATIAQATDDRATDALKGVLVIGSCLDPTAAFDEPDLPLFQFGSHLSAELAAYDGGIPMGFGAHRTVHAWSVTQPPVLPMGHQRSFVTPDVLLSLEVSPADAPMADGALTRIAQLATAYSGPVIVGHEPFLDRITSWGFMEMYRGDRVRRLQWQGCPLQVERSAGVPAGWRAGWLPLTAPLHEGQWLEPEAGSTDIGPVGCGPVWLEVRDAQGRTCAEADPNGWVVVDTRRQSTVRCTRPALP